MLRIRYLYHSGFMVELDHHVLIFDYYPHPEDPFLDPQKFPADKTIIFFVSHRHQDHYTRAVLDWTRQYFGIYAVISSDVPYEIPHERITVMRPHETKQLQDISIQTLLSTDEGVAFLLRIEGLTIYHAGDLNWWHWFGEDEDWNREMAVNYKKEIDTLANVDIDYAFLPLDPRLEEAYDWGVKYFLEHVPVRFWLPMHFADHPQCLEHFVPPAVSHMIPLTKRGETWDYPEAPTP